MDSHCSFQIAQTKFTKCLFLIWHLGGEGVLVWQIPIVDLILCLGFELFILIGVVDGLRNTLQTLSYMLHVT